MYVIVTKPGQAGQHLCAEIEKMGQLAIHFPTIDFVSLTDTSAFQSLLTKTAQQDWLIFISPTAVAISLPVICDYCTQFPGSSMQIAAIGKSSASLLNEALHVPVIYPDQQANSENLLNLPQFQAPKDKKIMLVKGQGGLSSLKDGLTKRGAIVSELIAYKRILPQLDPFPTISLFAQKKVNAIIATSGECITNLKILLGESIWREVLSTPVIVISNRIKILAEDLGFQTIWVTSDTISILNILTKIRMQI